MIRSWNRGQTWGDWSIIAGQPWLNTPYRAGTSHNETSAIMLDETTMLAVVRADSDFHTEDGAFCSEGGLGELRWTVSHDVGFTWAPVKPLVLVNRPTCWYFPTAAYCAHMDTVAPITAFEPQSLSFMTMRLSRRTSWCEIGCHQLGLRLPRVGRKRRRLHFERLLPSHWKRRAAAHRGVGLDP